MPTFEPGSLTPKESYFLLTSLVVPRPIAWVGTTSSDGVDNLAPHSFFNVVSSDPPIVHFTSSGVKDSLTNVRATGEFTVSIVSLDLLDPMNATAADCPPDVDEFKVADVEKAASDTVAPPRVAAAPAALECRVRTILSMGTGHMVFGDVTRFHVADRVWADGRVDLAALRPLGRLAGSSYLEPGEPLRRPRPTWAELSNG